MNISLRPLLLAIFLVLTLSSFLNAQDLLHKQAIPFPGRPPGAYEDGMAPVPEGRALYPGLFGHSDSIGEVYSAQSKQFAGVADGGLYVRAIDSDELISIAEPKTGWLWDVEGAKWNPEGTRLLVRQIDVRDLGTITLTDEDGNTWERTYSFMGEPLERHQYFIVDVESKNALEIAHGLEYPFVHAVGWHRGKAYLLRADRMMHQLDLLEVGETGEMRTIISEKSESYIIGLNLGQHYDYSLDGSNVVVFDGDRIIWTSERSGSRQLYLYSLDGELIRELTNRDSNGIVSRADMATNGWVYFEGYEINVGSSESLVDSRFYRVSIETGELEIITEGPVIILTLWTPDKDRFWVFRGDLHTIICDEFDADGKKRKTFWKRNIKQDDKFGYAPEYVWTETEDGEAVIGSAILKPKDFDKESSYPVVEYIYGPPFYDVMPWSPFDRRTRQFQDLANEGFIVVFTDARGTELRGREYQDYSYGRLGQVEIDDHAYVLEQLGKQRPYLDMSRVGIIGHSMGGYYSLRAMILRPDLYKAGHINAPNVDPAKFRVPLEPYMGCLPNDCPDIYAAASVSDRLDKITGKIHLTFGTADQHIPPSEFYRLIDAMDAAGYTDYTTEVYQGMHHQVMQNPKWYPAMVEFFKRELQGATVGSR